MAKQLDLTFVNVHADALWYIDGNWKILEAKAVSRLQET